MFGVQEVAIHQDAVLPEIAERLKRWNAEINPEKLRLLSMQSVTWNNGALGCPMPGKYYTQALVPGYLIWLKHDSTIIELHTDQKFHQIAIPGFGNI